MQGRRTVDRRVCHQGRSCKLEAHSVRTREKCVECPSGIVCLENTGLRGFPPAAITSWSRVGGLPPGALTHPTPGWASGWLLEKTPEQEEERQLELEDC